MRPMPELEVREMAVADIVPYANNAKMHPREQIDQIAESISEFGNCDPIAVWHNDDGEAEIVEGHGRVLTFCKGDPREAAGRLGEVVIPDLEEQE